ncbi:MAG: Uma2 family endonuclease [Acetobacteraceae bacterium]|nr:Uma2 family endonuclease [Acetobacteraceae bacterium]
MDDGRAEPTRHKLDVDVLYRMADAGIFGEDDRIELIDGELIDMAPIGTDHAVTSNGLTRALVLACGDLGIVSVANPLRIDRFNEPQPDFVVFRPRADNYRTGERGGPADALLVVEVADSSLRFDRKVKLPLYARAGIAEVWIADLRRRVLEAHRDPVEGAYATVQTYREGDRVSLALAPEIAVKLERVFD